MNLMKQWQYLDLTRNYILLPAKSIMRYRQVICSRLYIRLNVTCLLAS